MNTTSTLKSYESLHLLCCNNLTKIPTPSNYSPLVIPTKTKSKRTITPHLEYNKHTKQSTKQGLKIEKLETFTQIHTNGYARIMAIGGISVGVVMLLMGLDDHHKAMALGPEGPLMEEFWDNVRRYAIYALTVSTGALYTIFQPIVELLKNPVSAVLVLVIFAGGFYLVSQVLSAMVGVTDFSYDYSY